MMDITELGPERIKKLLLFLAHANGADVEFEGRDDGKYEVTERPPDENEGVLYRKADTNPVHLLVDWMHFKFMQGRGPSSHSQFEDINRLHILSHLVKGALHNSQLDRARELKERFRDAIKRILLNLSIPH